MLALGTEAVESGWCRVLPMQVGHPEGQNAFVHAHHQHVATHLRMCPVPHGRTNSMPSPTPSGVWSVPPVPSECMEFIPHDNKGVKMHVLLMEWY